jgi:hypothetical protein
MPYNLKDSVRHKFDRNHYNKRDWKTYEQGLRDRGSLTIWFCEDAIAAWHPPADAKKKKGGQVRYTDLAIETSQTLRIIYNHGLRQTEGFMLSLVQLMKLDITIPDHTTISRRSSDLAVINKAVSPNSNDKIVVILDSTGLKVVGEKEWMNCKHGTKQRKVWRKLHLCMDADGRILSSTLTLHLTSDPSQVDELLQGVDVAIDTFIGDGGYDSPAVYAALTKHQERHKQEHQIQAIVPPNIGFQEEKDSDPLQRLGNIHMIEDKGKLCWQNEMDYGRRARVENSMHRYKAIIGNKLRSKKFKNQITETKIAVKILNRMIDLGMPRAQKAA